MLRRHGTLLTLALLLCGTAMSGETPDVDVGATAPAIKGKNWFSTDSKAPELIEAALAAK